MTQNAPIQLTPFYFGGHCLWLSLPPRRSSAWYICAGTMHFLYSTGLKYPNLDHVDAAAQRFISLVDDAADSFYEDYKRSNEVLHLATTLAENPEYFWLAGHLLPVAIRISPPMIDIDANEQAFLAAVDAIVGDPDPSRRKPARNRKPTRKERIRLKRDLLALNALS